MSYNRNRNSGAGGGMNKWQQNNYGNNLGSVNPWDSGAGLNAQANVLSSLVGNAPDAVQQLLAASKILTNVLAPQQGLLQTPQVPSLLGQGAFGNRGQIGNYDNRFRNNSGGGRDNWGHNRRNDSGNYRNNNSNTNRGNQNQRNNYNNKNASSTSLSSSVASQKKENKVKKHEETAAVKELATSADKNESKPKEENRYADIPKALLFCHVCRKYMWDDVSFDNHIKGRNHKSMLDELDKLYKMQCEIMRQEFRMSEQQHGWYYDKAQRMGKKLKKPLEYCTMCDLNYHGTRGYHRKSTKHQELKHFLHPKCNLCNLEFPTRLEWDEHILLPNHLKKMTARRNELKPDLKDEFDFDDFLYVSDLSDYLSSDLKPASSILTDTTPVVLPEKDEEEEKEDVAEEDDADKEKKDKKEKKEKVDETAIVFHQDENNILETYIEEIRNLTEEEYSKKAFIVRYNASIPSGVEFVVQSAGHLCRICNLFVGSRDEALKHCKAYAHHISLVNLLAKVNQARKTVRKRSYKDGKDEDVEMKETADGEEGNWKRRKTEDGKDKKMDVDDDEEEEEEETHLNGNAEEDDSKVNDTKEETVKEETDEEETQEVKASETSAGVRSTPQRARRGRQRK